ncbi:MAG: phosphoenolpyruvate--protein phosphotransferase [Lachnospiraceae bacterium]|nr:phosphoenolpyruvate--protein phosphotransferase [Lachnospiraceae bacterium]
MLKFSGKSVLPGVAIGKMYIFKKQEYTLVKEKVADAEAEITRFHDACEKGKAQLDKLYEKTLADVGEEHAAIFEVHKMMMEDLDYLEAIEAMIREESCNAEYAVTTTGDTFADTFASMDDDYFKARSADVLDISRRIVRVLAGIKEAGIDSDEPVIIVADDLTPSETVQMDKSKILAFVTRYGSQNSHTAILARSMNLPSLINTNIELLDEFDGKIAVVDSFHDTLIVNPDENTMRIAEADLKRWKDDLAALDELIGQENVTRDGRKVNVYANIGNVEDLPKVLKNDAGGIGLFRSEFVYLGSKDYPTEDEQFEAYRQVVEGMGGKKVIIRTLDIGADKQADYFHLDHEENPAMGLRAIRICLERMEVFKTQLRAIYRASAFGKCSIMFPMIISVWEIKKIKEIVEVVKKELTAEGHAIGEVELGIMIETPAAVMMSDELAKEVEFFSIGTNDLTQYTLAIDRQNECINRFYDSHHPAVLKMIQMTIDNGHKNGIWVGICGELASDLTLTETFMDMGIDELSVSPTYVLPLRKKIREI